MLSIFKDIPLRTRRALSLYNVYDNSALLVLNGIPLNSDSNLLALNWQYFHATCCIKWYRCSHHHDKYGFHQCQQPHMELLKPMTNHQLSLSMHSGLYLYDFTSGRDPRLQRPQTRKPRWLEASSWPEGPLDWPWGHRGHWPGTWGWSVALMSSWISPREWDVRHSGLLLHTTPKTLVSFFTAITNFILFLYSIFTTCTTPLYKQSFAGKLFHRS